MPLMRDKYNLILRKEEDDSWSLTCENMPGFVVAGEPKEVTEVMVEVMEQWESTFLELLERYNPLNPAKYKPDDPNASWNQPK